MLVADSEGITGSYATLIWEHSVERKDEELAATAFEGGAGRGMETATGTAPKRATDLLSVVAALEFLSDALGERATLRHARLFLEVAVAGEIDQGAVAKKIGGSATVRMAQALGPASPYKDEDGRRREGLGLIRSAVDPVDYRLRKLSLAAGGEELLSRLLGRIEGK